MGFKFKTMNSEHGERIEQFCAAGVALFKELFFENESVKVLEKIDSDFHSLISIMKHKYLYTEYLSESNLIPITEFNSKYEPKIRYFIKNNKIIKKTNLFLNETYTYYYHDEDYYIIKNKDYTIVHKKENDKFIKIVRFQGEIVRYEERLTRHWYPTYVKTHDIETVNEYGSNKEILHSVTYLRGNKLKEEFYEYNDNLLLNKYTANGKDFNYKYSKTFDKSKIYSNDKLILSIKHLKGE